MAVFEQGTAPAVKLTDGGKKEVYRFQARYLETYNKKVADLVLADGAVMVSNDGLEEPGKVPTE